MVVIFQFVVWQRLPEGISSDIDIYIYLHLNISGNISSDLSSIYQLIAPSVTSTFFVINGWKRLEQHRQHTKEAVRSHGFQDLADQRLGLWGSVKNYSRVD